MGVRNSGRSRDYATQDPTHCYLCGRPLSNPTSKDHCPPRALFSRELRREHNLSRLLTIPVHKECNASYQLDEDYFIATITPLAPGSVAGDSIFKERMKGARNDKRKRALATRILDEFEPEHAHKLGVPEFTLCRVSGRTTAAARPRSPAGRGVSTQGGPRVWSLLRE